MDRASEINADADECLSDLGPWQDGLGVWLSAFLRLRHLRQARDYRNDRLGQRRSVEPGAISALS